MRIGRRIPAAVRSDRIGWTTLENKAVRTDEIMIRDIVPELGSLVVFLDVPDKLLFLALVELEVISRRWPEGVVKNNPARGVLYSLAARARSAPVFSGKDSEIIRHRDHQLPPLWINSLIVAPATPAPIIAATIYFTDVAMTTGRFEKMNETMFFEESESFAGDFSEPDICF